MDQTIVIDIMARFRDQTTSGSERARESVDRFRKSVEKTKSQVQGLSRTKWQVMLDVKDKASMIIDKVRTSARNLAGRTFSFAVKVLDYATAPLRGLLNFATSLKGIITSIIMGVAAKKTLIEPMMMYQDYTMAGKGFETMLGSKQASQAFMKKIEEFAIRTPFKASGIIANAQQMLNAGWNQKTVLQDLEKIGNVSAAFGLNDEGMQAMIRGFAQIRSKGVLSAEEMTSQLGEKIPAWKLLAEGMGLEATDKNILKVKEMAEKKLIGAEEGISYIMTALKKYDGYLEWMANNTVSGLSSQIADVFEFGILRKWGQGLSTGVIPMLQKAVKWVDENRTMLEGWGDTLKDIGFQFSSWVSGKIEKFASKLDEIFNRQDFKDADFWGKIEILWDDVIVKPLDEWWNSTGKDAVNGIFKTGGSLLRGGILGLLGITDSNVASDAAKTGAGFAESFLEGFKPAETGKAILDGIGKAFTNTWNDATTIFTDNASPTSGLSAALMAFLGIKGVGLLSKGIGGIFKGVDWAKKLFGKNGTPGTSGLPGSYNTATMTVTANIVYVNGALAGGGTPANPTIPMTPIPGTGANNGLPAGSQPKALPSGSGSNMLAEGYITMAPTTVVPWGVIEDVQNKYTYDTSAKIKDDLVNGDFGGSDQIKDTYMKNLEKYIYHALNPDEFNAGDISLDTKRIGAGVTGLEEALTVYAQLTGQKFEQMGIDAADAFIRGLTDNMPTGITVPWLQGGHGGGLGEKQREAKANGDITNGPEMALIGEAGPEAIIPLSRSRRARGIALWQRAGAMLGMGKRYATGDIVGGGEGSSSGGGGIHISLGGLSFSISAPGSDAESIIQALRENMPEVANELAGAIANMMGKSFANMTYEMEAG